MQAVRVHEFGDPSVMKVENIPIPEPDSNQILLHVKAAGVNPVDTYFRAGTFDPSFKRPFTLGLDAAGIVEKVGSDVTKFKKGDRVFICGSPTGTYAEYAIALESRTFSLPENVTFEQGAGLGIPYLTAYRTLFQCTTLEPKHTLLVHGASGAVGLACVQMARRHGVKQVIGTAGTDEAMQLLSSESLCGPGNVFNHRCPTYLEELKKRFPGGFDRVVEMLADVNLGHDVQLAAPKGEILVIGARGTSPLVDSVRIMMLEIRIAGVLLHTASEQQFQQAGNATVAAAKEGLGLPIVSGVFKFDKVAEAHTQVIAASKTPGKIVVLP